MMCARRLRLGLFVAAVLCVGACSGGGAWQRTPTDGLSARGHAAYTCTTDDELFVWGGGLPATGPGLEAFSDGAILAATGWTEIASNGLSARVRAGAAAVGEGVFVWGGAGTVVASSDLDDFVFPVDGALYLIAEDRWEMLPPSPLLPRANPKMEIVGMQVFVYGGESPPGPSQSPRNAALFDTESFAWTATDVPSADSVVAAVNDELYSFGAAGVEWYNQVADAWSTVQLADRPDLSNPSAAFSSGLGTVLLVQGGRVWEFDPVGETLEILALVPFPDVTSASITDAGLVVWSERDMRLSLLAAGETTWADAELPSYIGQREGVAICLGSERIVAWGGWMRREVFLVASDTGVSVTTSEIGD